ncbi:hypothetical protein [Bradyrhizobium sp. SZCCHNR2023]|uniref:hypothetical protein n=1 Tax=Bradyrhizobium sp. SZCCHNR2023 TaxID=3057380 RepID=UPI0029163AC1|nr:hypothetical protein [Bradyrhizobium sp. SZCCHNR2023]
MTTLIASNALVSLLVLAALMVFIYGPWQWICTDFARQLVFEKRDEIFDMAADGEFSFKSREYKTIRSSLEACIRYAHDLTWPSFVFLALSRKGRDHLTERSSLHEAVDALPEHIRDRVREKVTVAMVALIVMAVAKSPIATVVCVPVVLTGMFVDNCRKRVFGFAESYGELIQLEAEQSPSALKVLASA